MLYKQMLIAKILATTKQIMSTNEVAQAAGMSKQGVVQMMHRMLIMPCEIVRSRGPHGLYLWNMNEVRTSLKDEKITSLLKRTVC